ncbi:DUF3019 domain-containing protein [Microbulbifer sp. CAU 1566]|uniref:DUF3019 domain-containing protein n=1 Tax=Microbulbifer sp. CAU 1566 TaxID=2933269 RepID=UPI002002A5D1|nr:DUF3019 domain-containing protein [Microbulbifer sp. CAU 1566]MCK7597870.1 DUF3019 domain-containing protein [Microbulbifer sp. CAU 1566]
MKRQFFLLLMAIAPALVKAAELRLTPSVCAVDEGESSCNVSVKINFDADDNARYCLSIAGRGLVRCFWGDAEELKVYVNSPGDLRFQVTSGESGEGVAAAILKVAQYQPKRHRRRYGWGLL